MRKKQFRRLYNRNGHDNPVSMEEAIIELLKVQPDRKIAVPDSDIYPEGWDPDNSPILHRDFLVDFLSGRESIRVKRTDDNDRDSHIACMRLDASDAVSLLVYDCQESVFRNVRLDRLVDCRDAVRFALEFGVFDSEEQCVCPENLSDKQLDLLEQFQAAAEKLNDAGVSLVWDDDDNSLRAVNRDAVRDGAFYRDEPWKKLPEAAESLFSTPLERLDIEVTYMSSDLRLYYIPKD